MSRNLLIALPCLLAVAWLVGHKLALPFQTIAILLCGGALVAAFATSLAAAATLREAIALAFRVVIGLPVLALVILALLWVAQRWTGGAPV